MGNWPLLDAYKSTPRDGVRTVFRVEVAGGDLRYIPIEKTVDVHYGSPIYTVPQNYYPREGLILLFLRDYRGRKAFVRYERCEEGYLEEILLGHDLLDLSRAGVNVDALLETMVIMVEEKAATEYTQRGAETTYIPIVNICLPYSVVQANPNDCSFSHINELFCEGEPETCPLDEYDAEMVTKLSAAGYAHLVTGREEFLVRLRGQLESRAGEAPCRVRLYWKAENARYASTKLLPAFRDFLDRLGVATTTTTHTYSVAKVKRNRRLEFDIEPVTA